MRAEAGGEAVWEEEGAGGLRRGFTVRSPRPAGMAGKSDNPGRLFFLREKTPTSREGKPSRKGRSAREFSHFSAAHYLRQTTVFGLFVLFSSPLFFFFFTAVAQTWPFHTEVAAKTLWSKSRGWECRPSPHLRSASPITKRCCNRRRLPSADNKFRE